MKILHTSDWHIGQRFYRYDREEEHEAFFRQLQGILRDEKPDALLVSGDVYDTAAPSAQSQKFLVHKLLDLLAANPGMRIIVISGNHDSGSRLDALHRLWECVGIDVVGLCQRDECGLCDAGQFIVDIPGKGVVAAVPFFSNRAYPSVKEGIERDDRQKIFFQEVVDRACALAGGLPVVMMAHLTVNGAALSDKDKMDIGGIETTEIEAVGKGYDYLALGHIHKPQGVGFHRRARYSGSPIPLSFSEEHAHCVCLVEIAEHGMLPQVREIEIKPLRALLTIGGEGTSLKEALKQLAMLDDGCTAYVRILVDEDGLLPADAEAQAGNIAKEKKCRFCEIRKVAKAPQEAAGKIGRTLEISEIRSLSPMDIAGEAYERKYGEEMPERLRSLMSSVMESIKI